MYNRVAGVTRRTTGFLHIFAALLLLVAAAAWLQLRGDHAPAALPSPLLSKYVGPARRLVKMIPSHTTIVTLSNDRYRGRFSELLKCTRSHFGNETWVGMFALDDGTLQYFRRAARSGYPTAAELVPSGLNIRTRVLAAKLALVQAAVDFGKLTIFLEMDLYFRRDFFRLPPTWFRNHDVVFSAHVHGPEINYGFFVAWPTAGSRAFFAAAASVYVEIDSEEKLDTLSRTCGAFDQKAIDVVLRGCDGVNVALCLEECKFLLRSDLRFQKPAVPDLSWALIPDYAVPHWPVFGDRWPPELYKYASGVHVWSGSGPPDKQIAWAKENFVVSSSCWLEIE